MPPESVAFDRAADYYDETRGFPPDQQPPIAALIARAANLTRASRVIEVGIGTGRIALPLAEHVRAITGIDLARPMLNRLRAKRTAEPVHIAQGDITRLPLPSGTFDAALAVHVFHLIPGWQDALRETARVLRPDGVLISGWNDHARPPELEQLWQAWDTAIQFDTQPNVGVPRAQYRTFLADSGWRQVGPTLTHTYTSVQPVQQFVDRLERRVWSSMWRMPDDVHAHGIAAVRAALAEHAIDPQQVVESQDSFSVTVYLPPE